MIRRIITQVGTQGSSGPLFHGSLNVVSSWIISREPSACCSAGMACYASAGALLSSIRDREGRWVSFGLLQCVLC